MYCEDFAQMFFEFLHEYSNEPEMLNAIKPFIEYGWGSADEEKQVEFVGWMAEAGASINAIQAAISLIKD